MATRKKTRRDPASILKRFASHDAAITYANKHLGLGYRIVDKAPGRVRLQGNGEKYTLVWPSRDPQRSTGIVLGRDPAKHSYSRHRTRRRIAKADVKSLGSKPKIRKAREKLSREKYQVVDPHTKLIVGYVWDIWIGGADKTAKQRFGKHVHAYLDAKPSKVGDEGWITRRRHGRDPGKKRHLRIVKSDTDLLKGMKTYQLRILLKRMEAKLASTNRSLADEDEVRLIRAELRRRGAR